MKRILFCLAFLPFISSGQIINTIAGNGVASYFGDGGAATSAELNHACHIYKNASGNIYIPDYMNNRIRKIDPSGIITTIAGTGIAGFSGDGGAATLAQFNNPTDIFLDVSGNIYIADYENHRVRKINTTGVITTIAGNGVPGYSGDGGPATLAELNKPQGVCVDATGNVFIADANNGCIRKVTIAGIISTIAGNGTDGFGGDGGPATAAMLNNPYGICIDGLGNMIIGDQSNHRIRKINTSGIISTIAGNGIAGFSGDGGPATSAQLNIPSGVSVSTGPETTDIYIADQLNNRIRKINGSGIITTFAGTGGMGYSGDGGPATAAMLNNPNGVYADATGNIYIADFLNSRIREILHVSTATKELSSMSLVTIYPNPAYDNFVIKLPASSTSGSVQLINEVGQMVLEQKITGSEQINLNGLPTGMYIVKVTYDGAQFYKKVYKN